MICVGGGVEVVHDGVRRQWCRCGVGSGNCGIQGMLSHKRKGMMRKAMMMIGES